MRAMILAAGLGTRMRPLTDFCPKPLLPLMLQPMLDRILTQLQQHDIREVAVNVHHHAERVQQWLGDGSRWGIHQLHVSHEPVILGTAGGIKQVAAFLRHAPFLVINGDVLVDLDLHAVHSKHMQQKALVTMVVRPDANAAQYGPVLIDPHDRVLQINGRPAAQTQPATRETIFTGIQILSPQVLDRIPSGRFVGTTTDIYPALLTAGAVCAYLHTAYWMDIGVPARYLQAHWDILNGRLGRQWCDRLPPGSQVFLDQQSVQQAALPITLVPPVVVGPRTQIAPDARVGPYTVLGAGTQVGPEATIEHSVTWEDVTIAARATVTHSILASGVRISESSRLHNAVRLP